MEQIEILVELDPGKAEDVITEMLDNDIGIEGPDEVDSLDGMTLASFIVIVTPVVAPFVVEIIGRLRGNRGRIIIGDKIIDFKNFSTEQLKTILQIPDSTTSTEGLQDPEGTDGDKNSGYSTDAD